MSERIAVIGLGYVGLPLAAAFARAFGDVVGFDISTARVEALRRGEDVTGELTPAELHGVALRYSADPADLADRTLIIIAVPTPIDDNRQPDLEPLRSACRIVGQSLRSGGLVVLESTVYPGVTEELCGPLLAEASGLTVGVDFALGYSPERVNPGDQEHRVETIVKVVAASDPTAQRRLVAAYGRIIAAGLHVAPSIRIAEAAKVIENTQRDLNIALMNESLIIFDRLGLRTRDVLEAAASKWNFLRFTPGLVGGHCIGVDPYYLTAKAQSVGYHPEVILAGRRINDGMGKFVAQKLVKMLIHRDVAVRQARVGILGLTFKENVPDVRNSRVPDIVRELREFGIGTMVHDPLCDPGNAHAEHTIELSPLAAFRELDALILAVPHRTYLDGPPALVDLVRPGGTIIDIKSALDLSALPHHIAYWSL